MPAFRRVFEQHLNAADPIVDPTNDSISDKNSPRHLRGSGRANAHRVLLADSNSGDLALYSDLVEQIGDCTIEKINPTEDFFGCFDPSRYQLMILPEEIAVTPFLEELKRTSPRTSIVVVSQRPTVEKAVEAIRAGAEDYLSKPVTVDSFQLAIKRCLSKQASFKSHQTLSMHQLIYVDEATGLYNSRYLNQILDREISRAKLTQKSFAVLFIDADCFKNINDLYGHLAGTRLLNELGAHLKNYVREKDTVFRYGGDEFVAVLSACDLNTAKSVAERIRKSVERRAFLKNEGFDIHLTISIGIGLFPDHAASKSDIIAIADHAMYRAKKAARNRIFVSELDRGLVEESLDRKGHYGRC